MTYTKSTSKAYDKFKSFSVFVFIDKYLNRFLLYFSIFFLSFISLIFNTSSISFTVATVSSDLIKFSVFEKKKSGGVEILNFSCNKLGTKYKSRGDSIFLKGMEYVNAACSSSGPSPQAAII